jgi:hypothetical protein
MGLAVIYAKVMKTSRLAIHEGRIKRINRDDRTMSIDVIQDWTDTHVPLKLGDSRDVKYKVFQKGTQLFQEIRDPDGTLIHKLELPEGMAMKQISYEVLCRYVLTDVINP